jgi:hypothetical protein
MIFYLKSAIFTAVFLIMNSILDSMSREGTKRLNMISDNIFCIFWNCFLNMPASHIIQTFLFRAEKPLNALCTYIQSGQVKLLANSYFWRRHRNHIQSFQTMPSHYCRASTNRKYLEPGLSITKMYNMYKEHCASNDILPQKRHLYSSIFNYEFNLGFHVPRTSHIIHTFLFRAEKPLNALCTYIQSGQVKLLANSYFWRRNFKMVFERKFSIVTKIVVGVKVL